MRALTYHGQGDVRVDTHPDPRIEKPTDAIIRITSTAICGSDLHLFDGFVPMMKAGDIIGHEPMGVVEEVGSAVKNIKKGDRVVVSFTISCGSCWFCEQTMYSLCDNSNPKPENAEKAMGHSPAGVYGYSHLLGGIPGGQAEYLRVPYADVGTIKIASDLPDEKVLFLSDIFPTGYMAAENAQIEDGDTVAIWGCGPVGQFAIQSAWMMGAGRVIAIDQVPERLALAKTHGKAETIDFSETDVLEKLKEMTGGRGPDRCIDAVGAESHAANQVTAAADDLKQTMHLQSDRPYVLQQAIMACRKGGTLSVPGVYAQNVTLPFGAAMNKGLTFKMGQTHVQRYLQPLLDKIEAGEIDPSFLITHTEPLENAPEMYKTFRDKKDGCIKVVLKP
ncbi:threonine dehydrogenase-like Zn-dependent dehydrogenase [Lewinella aquimaris]|uniref:Threonine dehydrogenase-like Zn-dependent dehydrogenase n=1 Tax=Neolewinella aquimaris TaxID=1835722 RepID=A0A840E9A5_9BACT|nr:zinc-dependent alcohol dehydrogenase [Neolewinella aquimaris]MBB4077626.1 threonine dehydrogenase-like Zn-dependent dehydrogenase [Neolewinella aquimaris]